MDESEKIWEVFGPNFSDDSRVSAPKLGVYQGCRENIINWVAINHPGFRDDLEKRRVELREIRPKLITSQMVKELRAAKKAEEDAKILISKLQE